MQNVKLRASLFGGYPFEGIKSEDLFPNRIHTDIVDGKVMATISHEHYPQVAECDTPEKMNDFYLDRIHDYNHALNIAENQIRDTRVDMPFQPDDFYFAEHTTEKGVFFTKKGWLMLRGKGTKWIIQQDGAVGFTEVDLPTLQIAFITLRALGIVMDEEFAKGIQVEINVAEDELPPEGSGLSMKEWAVVKMQREHAKKFGSGKGVWDEQLNKFIVPSLPEYPKRLWGTELMQEDFEWIRHEDDFTEKEVTNG